VDHGLGLKLNGDPADLKDELTSLEMIQSVGGAGRACRTRGSNLDGSDSI
jgi:hypothetical protein